MVRTDTIAAIATPVGEGGIGIIRISGPQALSLAGRIFLPSDRLALEEMRSHTVHHGWVHQPDSTEKIDEALLLVMKGPHSYTGEDVAEIHGHGGAMSTKAVLEAALQAGARIAEPGEFTRRAFMNGRLDLAQAEAVAEIINAKSAKAREAAVSQLGGGLSREITEIRDRLMSLVAEAESSMDFDEEETECISMEKLAAGAVDVALRLESLLDETSKGTYLQEGASVIIIGRPNVGKSSIFNALLDESRAIVTPCPGTTRDAVEGWMNIAGLPVRLVDSAGIREAENIVEEEGIRRSLENLAKSDTAIIVIDASLELSREDRVIGELVSGKKSLLVLNKSDLPAKTDPDQAVSLFPGRPVVKISCINREGLEDVRAEILKMIGVGEVEPDRRHLLTANVRQKEAMRQSLRFLNYAVKGKTSGLALDAFSSDLRLSLEALGQITGETATEDILNAIFSRFCVGK